jgi:hypothetical protein
MAAGRELALERWPGHHDRRQPVTLDRLAGILGKSFREARELRGARLIQRDLVGVLENRVRALRASRRRRRCVTVPAGDEPQHRRELCRLCEVCGLYEIYGFYELYGLCT